MGAAPPLASPFVSYEKVEKSKWRAFPFVGHHDTDVKIYPVRFNKTAIAGGVVLGAAPPLASPSVSYKEVKKTASDVSFNP